MLQQFPDTPERNQQELSLQIALAGSLTARQGFAAPGIDDIYAAAQELCQKMGETPELFPVLWGMGSFHMIRGEMQRATELGQQCLNIAQRVQDPSLLLVAHLAQGRNFYFAGTFAASRAHLEHGTAVYDSSQHHSLVVLYRNDPGVECLSRLAHDLWFLGYPDQALGKAYEAIALAQQLPHPPSQAFALDCAVECHLFRREGATALELNEEALRVAQEQESVMYVGMATALQGRTLVELGQADEGTEHMRRASDILRSIGMAMVPKVWLAASQVEGYLKAGRIEEGLSLAEEALNDVAATGFHFLEAELYRLKGELLLRQSREHPQAGACFQTALGVARDQKAKSLELRAATSLARLWQRQGKQTEARALLAPVYDWFTEGFDTADLKDAKALLDQLS